MNYIIKPFSLFPLIRIKNEKLKFCIYILGINIISISKRSDRFYVKLFKKIPILKIVNKDYFNINRQQNNYLKIIDRIKNKKINGDKINVVFFINEISKWKTRKLYETLLVDNRFNVKILATYLPVYNKFATDREKEIKLIKKFFEQNNLENTFIESNDKKSFKNIVKDADIFFITQPWGLKEYMKPYNISNCLIYYIPYFVPNINNMILDYRLNFHSYLFRYYLTNEEWEIQFKGYAKKNTI